MAAQRTKAVGDIVPAESQATIPGPAEEVVLPGAEEYVSELGVTLLGGSMEVTYSRSWELAPVKFEAMKLFTSHKVVVPVNTDLADLGQWFHDKMNEIQGPDLNFAADLANNDGSLVTRIFKK